MRASSSRISATVPTTKCALRHQVRSPRSHPGSRRHREIASLLIIRVRASRGAVGPSSSVSYLAVTGGPGGDGRPIRPPCVACPPGGGKPLSCEEALRRCRAEEDLH